ncbi:MAG: hypothetical protein NT091_02280 [Candidatus Falkowbacteria bacterium]|nr:hypothetical protein [Candidatus Falkowbacteria bacterium]
MKKNIHPLIKEIFYFLTVTLSIFVGMELFWPKIVLAYLNINIVVVAWVFSAIVLFLSKKN